MVAEPSRTTAGKLHWGAQGTEPQVINHDLLPHISPSSTSRPGTIDESLATFLSTPTRPEDVPEDAVTADDGVVKMVWRSRAVINNIGVTLKDLVENQNTSTSCLNNTLRSISDWANSIEEKLAMMDAKPPSSNSGFPGGAKPVSEIRAITNLEQLGTDKGEFRNWSDRLTNALVQKYPKYRIFMNKLKEAMDQKNKLLSDLNPHDEVGTLVYISQMEREKIEEDLYFILVEKTKRGSEAAQRVATVEPGQLHSCHIQENELSTFRIASKLFCAETFYNQVHVPQVF